MIERECDPSLGTLMWIGDESHPEFRAAFEHCASRVSQLAVRRDLHEAMQRPAASVRWILQAQASRDCSDWHRLQHIDQSYPQAAVMQLLATLCEGMKPPAECELVSERIYWHQWEQALPGWLGRTASHVFQPPSSRRVVIVASTFAQAEPLLDVAEEAGAAAIWCRQPNPRVVRSVDTVWWDDSVAGPAQSHVWRARTDEFSRGGRPVQHAWIANAPRLQQSRQAVDGGIDVVLSKPHRLEGLLSTLARANEVADVSVLSRRAA